MTAIFFFAVEQTADSLYGNIPTFGYRSGGSFANIEINAVGVRGYSAVNFSKCFIYKRIKPLGLIA